MIELNAWLHRKVRKHDQHRVRVTVPMFDPSSRGILIKCGCGKSWAR